MSTRKILALFTGLLVLPLAACDVDQTEAGEMPDVEVEEGDMPEYDVEGPEVETGMDRDTVVVDHPTVDVEPPQGEGEMDPNQMDGEGNDEYR